ncbi:chromosome-associated kinesin kif4a [Stylonychia lemnae]|uniref:Chromosome-associated kinesin kif4a n=1 Tax=Stylonychia lemnae TaxID=5949 RepID=A0A078A0F2_STYLE|nr:chromosome-associated kinesin kif4a [Stylonychia lemnae]|eukprot:CDW75630.1 chromosome-associated kinesin kif4a [Stylonychia lemnae]
MREQQYQQNQLLIPETFQYNIDDNVSHYGPVQTLHTISENTLEHSQTVSIYGQNQLSSRLSQLQKSPGVSSNQLQTGKNSKRKSGKKSSSSLRKRISSRNKQDESREETLSLITSADEEDEEIELRVQRKELREQDFRDYLELYKPPTTRKHNPYFKTFCVIQPRQPSQNFDLDQSDCIRVSRHDKTVYFSGQQRNGAPGENYQFQFDQILDHQITNESEYHHSVKNLIRPAISSMQAFEQIQLYKEFVSGVSQTVCVCGPQFGGKTTFLFGHPEPNQIQQNTFNYILIEYLFAELKQQSESYDYAVKLGIVEVDQKIQELNDLIEFPNSPNLEVILKTGIIQNITEQYVSTMEDIEQVYAKAFQNRKSKDQQTVMIAQFTLVQMINHQEKEGFHTQRKSYLRIFEGTQLNNTIYDQFAYHILSKPLNGYYVSLRDSILTRTLMDAFGGNQQMSMILCLNPSVKYQHDTLQSLKLTIIAQDEYFNKVRIVKQVNYQDHINIDFQDSSHTKEINYNSELEEQLEMERKDRKRNELRFKKLMEKYQEQASELKDLKKQILDLNGKNEELTFANFRFNEKILDTMDKLHMAEEEVKQMNIQMASQDMKLTEVFQILYGPQDQQQTDYITQTTVKEEQSLSIQLAKTSIAEDNLINRVAANPYVKEDILEMIRDMDKQDQVDSLKLTVALTDKNIGWEQQFVQDKTKQKQGIQYGQVRYDSMKPEDLDLSSSILSVEERLEEQVKELQQLVGSQEIQIKHLKNQLEAYRIDENNSTRSNQSINDREQNGVNKYSAGGSFKDQKLIHNLENRLVMLEQRILQIQSQKEMVEAELRLMTVKQQKQQQEWQRKYQDQDGQIRSLTLSLQKYISDSNLMKVDFSTLQLAHRAQDKKNQELIEAFNKEREELERLKRVLRKTNENLAELEYMNDSTKNQYREESVSGFRGSSSNLLTRKNSIALRLSQSIRDAESYQTMELDKTKNYRRIIKLANKQPHQYHSVEQL